MAPSFDLPEEILLDLSFSLTYRSLSKCQDTPNDEIFVGNLTPDLMTAALKSKYEVQIPVHVVQHEIDDG